MARRPSLWGVRAMGRGSEREGESCSGEDDRVDQAATPPRGSMRWRGFGCVRGRQEECRAGKGEKSRGGSEAGPRQRVSKKYHPQGGKTAKMVRKPGGNVCAQGGFNPPGGKWMIDDE
mmetsp:Transcript_19098/g.19362  ORF Transcript_19098/g.19362 Transcript_19098/m.19362 type:complete len:118 (-) Transcript_19098:14-367(-)